jgi:hypothetical protein
MTYYRVIIPVTVIGPAEKYNPNAWKTDAFYGNPVAAFTLPYSIYRPEEKLRF